MNALRQVCTPEEAPWALWVGIPPLGSGSLFLATSTLLLATSIAFFLFYSSRQTARKARQPPTPAAEAHADGPGPAAVPPMPVPSPQEPAPTVAAPLPDGDHTVDFPDGTQYSGQWADGRMQGRGVMLWPSGDRYEGEWRAGAQHGQGTFAAADGSMYFGGWASGRPEGAGVFRPAPPASIIYLRTYANGELTKETSLRVDDKDLRRKKEMKEARRRSAARPLLPGEAIYKGHHSYDLMRQLQMGIMYGIAQAGRCAGDLTAGAAAAPTAPLSLADFEAECVQHFPDDAAGAGTPAFKWKDYSPRAFQRLRAAFGIEGADYLVSLTGDPALRELPSPGASGCIFFLSSDDRFLIKSVRKEEMEMLLALVPQYVSHVKSHPGTLLVRFFGVHRVSPWLGRNARFLVMGNVLPSDKAMHRKYDLKGSSYKRTVGTERRRSGPSVALKDLDVDLRFEIEPQRHAALMAALADDAEFLEGLHVIDYSLLLGVHFVRWGEDEWYPPFEDWPEKSTEGAEAGGEGAEDAQEDDALGELPAGDGESGTLKRGVTRSSSLAAGISLVETLESLSSAGVMEPALSRRAASVVASADSSRLAARLSAAEASSKGRALLAAPWAATAAAAAQLATPGVRTPTSAAYDGGGGGTEGDRNASTIQHAQQKQRAFRSSSGNDSNGDTRRGAGWAVPAVAVRRTSTGGEAHEPVLLYFGIIDFLQRYNARKRLERVWKASLHGPTVSVADPHRYAQRFLAFMNQVFVPAAAVAEEGKGGGGGGGGGGTGGV